MIELKITNLDQIVAELENKYLGVKELSSPEIKTEFGHAIYKITKKAFLTDINRIAKMDKNSFHHIYEWNKTGDDRYRLFDILKVADSGGKMIITYKLLESRTQVPVDPALLSPGANGKSVKKRYIFAKKAEVMEYGKTSIFKARNNIAFVSNGAKVFRPKGISYPIRAPRGTRGKLDEYFNTWYREKAASAVNRSKIIPEVEKATALALEPLGSGAVQVRDAAIKVIRTYSEVFSV